MRQLAAAPDAEERWREICADLHTGATHVADLLDGPLYGLEPGVAAAVLALSAIGAIPYWSDGGGIHFGGANARPIVRFFARPRHVAVLLAAAEHANVAIEPYLGRCVVYADRPDGLLEFAAALLQRSQHDSV